MKAAARRRRAAAAEVDEARRQLRRAEEEQTRAADAYVEAVQAAKAAGIPHAEIGAAAGVTKQAIQKMPAP